MRYHVVESCAVSGQPLLGLRNRSFARLHLDWREGKGEREEEKSTVRYQRSETCTTTRACMTAISAFLPRRAPALLHLQPAVHHGDFESYVAHGILALVEVAGE